MLRLIFIILVIYTIYYFSESPKNHREERIIEQIDSDYDKKVGR